MSNYLLIPSRGSWKLKKAGARRARIDFFRHPYAGRDFNIILYASMGYAHDMKTLSIMNSDGTVRIRLGEDFIGLFREKE